ncbi:MAG: LysM peptidoglycan-binding domain-containing protein [Anaerolineales bacterium]|nr:LysM peptidoglycan-binding domain-containing protein [Anaerolineales bacterium]
MKKYSLAGVILIALVLVFCLRFPVQAAPLPQLTVFPTPTPGPDGRILYIVQDGDTLWRISAITGVSIDQLRALNNLGPDDPIKPGDAMLIGLAGPVEATPTPGLPVTPEERLPTATSLPGWGNLCVLLYNDLNGDSLRQETEPSIPGGAVSVSDRLGSVSLTATTPSGGISDALEPAPEDLGYSCFNELAEGVYNITVAIPDGYNPTTVLNRSLDLNPGDQTFLAFGAQANTETIAETAIIPETPGRSPILGIAGGVILLLGIGLGVYAFILRRSNSFKGQEGR